MYLRHTLTTRAAIIALLILQIVPLILFPRESYAPTSQEWWLTVLLVVMVIAADVELIGRRSDKAWPWHLIGFAHGFNIISRLMMLWPHATVIVDGATVFNAPYVILTVIAMIWSGLMLAYMDWPEVRMGLLRTLPATTAATPSAR
jgi:hypothetical protein